MRTIRLWLLLSLLPSLAQALPVLAVDTDPSTPGIQGGAELLVGSPITVDIVISEVSEFETLSGYQFTLSFDASLVSATLVEDGGFLPALVIGAPILPEVPGQIGFGATSLASVGASGTGILARVFLFGLAPGTTALDLSGIVLATVLEPGVVEPIAFDPPQSGSLTVVPEPGFAGLVAFALGLATATRARLRSRGRDADPVRRF
jgi:hypothetical protein